MKFLKFLKENLLLEAWYTTKETSEPIKIFVTNHEQFRQSTRNISSSSIEQLIEKGMKRLETYAIKSQRKVFVLQDAKIHLNIVGRFKGRTSFSLITVIRKPNFIRQSNQTIIKI